MKAKVFKRVLSLTLAASLMVIPVPQNVKAEVTVPDPYYEFTFDGGVTDNKVENEGTKTGVTAEIKGSAEGLGVMEDEVRGNHVLNLPGGSTNGAEEGRLVLPDDMFSDVTDEGFAFSFWINIDGNASQYSRIFSGTVNGQNSDAGGGSWNAPEFAFVAGSESASDLGNGQGGYHTSVYLPDRSAQLKLVWSKQFSRDTWQHVTISVSPTSYDVYLDGESVPITYDRNSNQSTILSTLFADDAKVLKQYKYCAIGSSVYQTDKDLKAKLDEFRFYNTALTKEQAKAAYDSYAVRDSVVESLRSKVAEAKEKSISFYTKESYEVLRDAIVEGEEGIENPVTEANVNRLISNIDTALAGLVYYTGITADTTFSNEQLTNETAEAKGLLAGGGLSAESEAALEKAITAADAALAAENDQKAVDEALIAVRKAVGEKSYGATLHFDADPKNSKSEVFHGSTGFLYGVSEVGVPSADLIKAIQPKILVQKAADGQQHPSGDGYRLTPYLEECGVENIQIYLQDYYLEWPYESNGIDDYNTKVEQIVTKMLDGKSDEEIAKYSFVIFNEPDGIWYTNKVDQMCNDWLTIYTTIKDICPDAKVAGPNFSVYNSSAYRKFFSFCKTNNCLPEYITWHELQKDKLTSFASHCKEVKEMVATYYAGSTIEPIIFVNETVNFDDVGNPGALVNWLSIFDEEDVYASLPYWGLANSMNELAADANKPNGAWWVYKWYAQMTGNKTPLTLENIGNPSAYGRLYGLTSVDDDTQMVYSLFGGQAGKQTVSIENLTSTKTFEGADMAHVKIYSTKYTGHHGFADEIPVEYEGNLPLSGDDLIFTIKDAELMDAYFAIITPATSDKVTAISAYEKNWEQTYEAEDAELIGNATAYTKANGGDLARSNRAEVGNMNTENDGVKFTVDVPQDGRYRMNIYYSSQAPQVDALTLDYVATGGQNRAVGALSTHTLSIDGGTTQEIVYDSTVKWGYYNYKTVYVDLTAGTHTMQLMYKGESQNGKNVNSMLCALLDKIDLVYEPDTAKVITVEPEELTASQSGYKLSYSETYSGAGAAVGSGALEFYVSVPRDGYYAVGTKGNGTAVLKKNRIHYANDAKAESAVTVDQMKLLDLTIGNENSGMVYLTAGINGMSVEGKDLTLDQITFTEVTEATEGNSITIEAEDCQLSGQDAGDAYTYLPGSLAVPKVITNAYASNEKAVEGFRGGKNNTLSFTVTVPEAGDYKLSVTYANDEPAPVMKKQDGGNYVHPYNTDLVERYAQIAVNGTTPQTVYFKNTLCWDTYKNTVIDVTLKKGSNTIVVSNDNSYKFSALQDDFTPRFDKFVIAPAATTQMKLPAYVPDTKGDTPQPTPSDPSQGNQNTGNTTGNTTDTAKDTTSEVTLDAAAFLTDNAGLPTGNKEESKNSAFAALSARVTKAAKTSNKIKWNKVKDADGYVVFGGKCNIGKQKNKFEVLTIIKGNGTTSYTHKSLKKGTYYKYIVQAYKVTDGKIEILSTSKTIHSATTGGKYGNVKSLKLNKKNVKLKKGGKFTLRVTEKKTTKNMMRHRAVAFESSNTKIATVNSKGVIKAKKKGSCNIYIYAQNGIYKKIKVTVK